MPIINLANVVSSCCHSIGSATATKDARSKGITLPNDSTNPKVGSHPGRFSQVLAILVVLGLLFGWFLLLGIGSDSPSSRPLKLLSYPPADSTIRYRTATDKYGETIYLTEVGSGVWQISDRFTGTRFLEFDYEMSYYRYADMKCSVWFRYNTNYEQPHWQCWYSPISDDYNQSGWMEYRDGSWYIESDEGKWIVLPEQYDTTYLFTIQTSVG